MPHRKFSIDECVAELLFKLRGGKVVICRPQACTRHFGVPSGLLTVRLRPWQVAALIIAIFGLGLGVLSWYQRTYPTRPAELFACLPTGDATLVWLDIDLLRKGGILEMLDSSKSAQEPEYIQFVEQTGFDYKRDLKSIAAAFTKSGTYYAIRGTFNWAKMAAYATSHGGACHDKICDTPGSTPERVLSFRLLNSGLMALAVTKDRGATSRIELRRPAGNFPAIDHPVWMSVPAATLRDAKELPAGTKSFATLLSNAQKVEFSADALRTVQGARPAGSLELTADVTCASAAEATALSNDLNKTTDLLRRMMERDGQRPSARDLSGVLVAGTFRSQDRRVLGSWPVERVFVESLAGGDAR